MTILHLNWLFLLLIAHLLFDFPFQRKAWVKQKNERHFKAPSLYLHAVLHALVSGAIVFAFLTLQGAEAIKLSIYVALIVGGSHLGIDLAKTYSKKTAAAFVVDQLLHVVVIACVWLWITTQGSAVLELLMTVDYTKISLLFLAYFALYMPTGILVGMLLSKWAPQSTQNGGTVADIARVDSLKKAGLWIGYLERTLILTFVLTDHISAVGFLFAAKSIFRFGELANAEHVIKTEYVLLGTLYSYTISLLVGFLVKSLL